MDGPLREALVLLIEPPAGHPFQRAVLTTSLTIGRSSKADLVLSDGLLSRLHARIFKADGSWLVEDLNSHNGTHLNGARLTGPEVLTPGDVLSLGSCQLRVEAEGGEELPTPPALGGLRGQALLRPAVEILRDTNLSRRAIAEAELSRLRQVAERLHLLIEVNQALARPVGLEELLDLILRRAFQHLQPEEGTVFLAGQNGEVRLAASRPLTPDGPSRLDSETLFDEVVHKRHAALVQDAQADARFNSADSVVRAGVRSLIAAPLLDPDGTALGMICLYCRSSGRRFDEEDLALLTSLAAVAALRIRNVELVEEALERRRLEDEIGLARTIQVALYPKTLPQFPGYEIMAFNLPSRRVSGDFYQVTTRREGRECVAFVADVSGKGLGAALLAASLEALSAAPLAAGRPPDRVLTRVSNLLYHRTPPEKYATAFLSTLHPESGRLRFANAGHPPGLLVRHSGSVRTLDATGAPLGMFPRSDYRCESVVLNPGDYLLLFTDGLLEARDARGEEYGLERLKEVAVAHRHLPAREVAGAIEGALDDFARGTPYEDDRTLVILSRLPRGT